MTGDGEQYDRDRYLFDEGKAGNLLLSERLMPSPLAWAILVGVLVLWFLALAPFIGIVATMEGMPGVVLFLGVYTAVHCLLEHQVRSRALLTGLTWPSARPYIIPWASVDPNKIRLYYRSDIPGIRDTFTSWTYRFAPWNPIVVSIPGLPPTLAHPRGSGRELEMIDPYPVYPMNYPTVPWLLGTRHPEQLLRAIERALVDAGRTDAHGLAARELAAYTARAAQHHGGRWRPAVK